MKTVWSRNHVQNLSHEEREQYSKGVGEGELTRKQEDEDS